ncbi:MAG: SH3 domain-containing protein, partial [Anaerolineae bacterium]|nr:SH3 domain-containing protein [Anaerolineae bacterium]
MKLASKAIFVAILLTLTLALVGGTATAADASQQVQFATPIAIANTSFLNVRTGPSIKYSVLLTVVGGSQLPVLGIASDRVWYQVSTVVGVGWLNSEFVIARGDFSNVPSIDISTLALTTYLGSGPTTIGLVNGQGGGGSSTITATSAPIGGTFLAGTDGDGNPIIVIPNERFRATLAVPAVDLRTAPGDSSPSLGTLFGPGSADYPIVNRGHDTGNIEWLAVITPQFGTGWIDAPKLRLRLSGAFHTVMVVVADTIGMRNSPGTNNNNLPVLTRGAEGFLVDISKDGKFIEIELPGGDRGWIPFDSAQARTGTPTDGLQLDPNMYLAGAGGGGVAIQGLPAPLSLSVPHVVLNTSYLNIRSGPGANYTSVATVSGGTELPVLGVAKDRVWFLVQGDFGRGWLNNEFAIFRGVYDNVPVINTSVVVGQIAQPLAVISAPTTLYAAPGTNFGSIATIGGPVDL